MTVTASGAITFSDLMTEFNSPGGASNIKLGEYAARYPDTGGGPMTRLIYVTWDGYQLKFGGSGASSDTSYYTYAGKLKIRLLLNSTVTRPVYIATTKNTSGSDLCSSGVANNGSAYNAASTYHSGSYTHIVIDLETAAAGTAEDFTKRVYVNTNIQQTIGSGGANVSQFYASVPDSNRYVTYNTPFIDIPLQATLAGGGENVKDPAGQLNTTSTGINPGMIKNGQSLVFRQVVDALPSHNTISFVDPMLGYFYPVTWTGTGLAQGFSTGSSGYLFFDTYLSGGGSWIGSGGLSNTASNVATVCRTASNPTAAYGSLSTTGWSCSWGGSGDVVECTLTNGTGNDYVCQSWLNTGGYRNTFNIYYIDSSPAYAYTVNTNGYSNGAADNSCEHYTQGANPLVYFGITNNDGSAGGYYGPISMYNTDSATRASVITTVSNYFNTAGGGTVSASYPGTQVGSGTGVAWPGLDAAEPVTGTLRLRQASQLGGGFFRPGWTQPGWSETRVVPDYPTYLTPNILVTGFGPTFSTVVSNLENNNTVGMGRSNQKMSEYYGTKNLGTDGG